MNDSPGDVTQLLLAVRRGDPLAQDQFVPLVYTELRRIAAIHLRNERANHLLQPTALVHEAYMRLIGIQQIEWQDRAHFFSVSSTLMRRILVDHARANRTGKRGGAQESVTLEEATASMPGRGPEVLALDDALIRLAKFDSRQAKIVEMRFFAGMTEEETGDVLGISARTVKRDWRVARAWLLKELSC